MPTIHFQKLSRPFTYSKYENNSVQPNSAQTSIQKWVAAIAFVSVTGLQLRVVHIFLEWLNSFHSFFFMFWLKHLDGAAGLQHTPLFDFLHNLSRVLRPGGKFAKDGHISKCVLQGERSCTQLKQHPTEIFSTFWSLLALFFFFFLLLQPPHREA